MSNNLKLIRAILFLAAVYYLIGGFAHFFGLTIFPWYDHRLYTPYDDSLIAMVCVVLAMFLIAIARDPVKNIDTLNVVIIGALLGSIFSIAIIWKVNFAALGAPDKKLQTIVEGILGFIFTGALLWLHPRRKK